ncbi:MAG: site-2 protease family protein [Candidatus Kerfeldbacteria bacterium]|nr:site-2 protease family protein [Candidatus Kerfeldbacteria bacterium]
MLINDLLERPIYFVLWVMAVILALTIHEFSHAFAGRLQGDKTAEYEGRLTLNPLAHIDWLGFFLLVVAGFGWAKPTPFNPYNLKYKRFGPALVALAGPIANTLVVVVIGTALSIIYRFGDFAPDNLMIVFFIILIQVNILLAVFNLIPIPPLDGAKLLYTFIGHKRPDIVLFLERYGMWLLLALVFFGDRFIASLFEFFYNLTLQLIF